MIIMIISITILSLISLSLSQFTPSWDSLDARKLPTWYDEGKIGIIMHYGVYSVPSWGDPKVSQASGEWFWNYWKLNLGGYQKFMEDNYRPGFLYQDFAASLKAELFDADEWAEILEGSGAKYYVITSKHHEGYCNWASNQSWNWNSVTVGPKRDFLAELSTALRKKNIVKFGLYFSLFEWFHPLFLADQANKLQTRNYVEQVMWPQFTEIVTKYKPELIWSDGDWEAPPTYWGSQEFLAWLYNKSPVKDTVVVNDRWGIGTTCKHGGYLTCGDRYHPEVTQNRKWEYAMTIDKSSWGFRRNSLLSDMMTTDELIESIVSTVAFGGNILINVGPCADGTIAKYFQDRLKDMGGWLKTNGEGIYGTTQWPNHQNDTLNNLIYYTRKANVIYSFIPEKYVQSGTVTLTGPFTHSSEMKVELLGVGNADFRLGGNNDIIVTFPCTPSIKWYGALKISGLSLSGVLK